MLPKALETFLFTWLQMVVMLRSWRDGADATEQNAAGWTTIHLATLNTYMAAATNSEEKYAKVIDTFRHQTIIAKGGKENNTVNDKTTVEISKHQNRN